MTSCSVDLLQLLDEDVSYVIPPWHRRYCWRQSNIKRFVEDILATSDADPSRSHYAGTLLTVSQAGRAEGVNFVHVVDGYQRLTTVSILLACIAEQLKHRYGRSEQTLETIQRLLIAHDPSGEMHFKLRLEGSDGDEYRSGYYGNCKGRGIVAQAWRTSRRLVENNGATQLLSSLERLRVVEISLDQRDDDPQQIFETLNSTGRPLLESEKIKNWLLMDLEEHSQREIEDRCWKRIEQLLGAEHKPERIDVFLRDVMRWRTGQTRGVDKTYDQFRRWALKDGYPDRRHLCAELAELAELYGIVTGTGKGGSGRSPGRSELKLARELRHLRSLGFDVHCPFTLRLLAEAKTTPLIETSIERLADVIAGIGTWMTRHWIAGRQMSGMEVAVAKLAHEAGPSPEAEDYVEHWLDRIQALQDPRTYIPDDDTVRVGIRERAAYGGANTQPTRAILCELMDAEHRGKTPSRDRLNVEHIMPERLSEEWSSYLGDNAEKIHQKHCDNFANLTLIEAPVPNADARTFAEKQSVYIQSEIGITQRIAHANVWNEMAIARRADELACRALERWPWPNTWTLAAFSWQLDDGPLYSEDSGEQMVLNVMAALLSLSPANAERLKDEAVSTGSHSANRYPLGTTVGSTEQRVVPGHYDWVLSPYAPDPEAYAERCRKLGKQCGVTVQVTIEGDGATTPQAFWKFFAKNTTDLWELKQTCRRGHQWTASCNKFGDRIGIFIGTPSLVALCCRVGSGRSENYSARMEEASQEMLRDMKDQKTSGDLKQESKKGRTIRVEHQWTRGNRDDWGEACKWIQSQGKRLRTILQNFGQGKCVSDLPMPIPVHRPPPY